MASVTSRLVYDPTAASASHSVGAYVLAGTDGEQIDSTSNALHVLFQNTTIAVTDGGGALTVDASQLDIDDLNATDDAVQAWCFDGTGTAITSTGGALDVNIASGNIDVDDSLADTAINAAAVAVSTSLIDVVASPLASRKWIALANEGNRSVFIGTTGDTAATGFPLHPGMQSVWRIGPTPALKIIGDASASSEDIRYLELS